MHQNVVAEISEAWVLMSLNLCWLVFVIEDFPVLAYVNLYLAPKKKNQHGNLIFLGKAHIDVITILQRDLSFGCESSSH